MLMDCTVARICEAMPREIGPDQLVESLIRLTAREIAGSAVASFSARSRSAAKLIPAMPGLCAKPGSMPSGISVVSPVRSLV